MCSGGWSRRQRRVCLLAQPQSCAPSAKGDLKAQVWSCFPAGAGVGRQAEACVNFSIKAAYRKRNALLLLLSLWSLVARVH